jgi:hypothetical protein
MNVRAGCQGYRNAQQATLDMHYAQAETSFLVVHHSQPGIQASAIETFTMPCNSNSPSFPYPLPPPRAPPPP